MAALWYNSEWHMTQKEEHEISQPVRTGMFSWDGEIMEPESRQRFFDTMDICQASALYQEFPQDQDAGQRKEFLQDMKDKDIEVYYLAGRAEWGLPGYVDRILSEIERAAEYEKKAGKGTIKGIVFDVEPYLTEEWDTEEEKVMESYVDNMTEAYKAAKREGLEVVVCIPYFFDSKGYVGQLERLISSACDTVAVMNYYKEGEYEHIFTEAVIARAYGKNIIHIAEIQKPGNHGLEEIHTYYGDGLDAVFSSWKNLAEQVGYEKLGFAFHYLTPAMELYLDGEAR